MAGTAPHIPDHFIYTSGTEHILNTVVRLARGIPRTDERLQIPPEFILRGWEALSEPEWGLGTLGYVHGGINGTTGSDNWHLPEVTAFINIYKPFGDYSVGRITVIYDDETQPTTHWVDVSTGIVDEVPGTRPSANFFNTQTHRRAQQLPGYPIFSAPFTDQTKFITGLRSAQHVLFDPDAAQIIHALTKLTATDSHSQRP